MISYRSGIVSSIVNEKGHITWIEVNINGHISKAVNYKDISGNICINDKVILNTTGVDLNLGTGGYHFVMFNFSNESRNLEGPGHIMKLRYTPYQMKCLVAEEEVSPYHEVFNEFKSLENHICIVATLHSMLAPISAMIKYLNSNININYIMTDGGALPLHFSNTVSELKEKGIINNTITIGHAFGGDLECINIYTGLIAAKEILKGNVTIISMGPGIVGSGTKYGFTGVEQGSIIDAINNLGGRAVAVPRISFSDNRHRHRGISHHTMTILSEMTNTKAYCVFPYLEEAKVKFITDQIELSNIGQKHSVVFQDGEEILDAMNKYNLKTTSMGRTIEDDKEYFTALGAVGKFVVSLL
ncbi:DUF3866 family protein [Tissierella sp.]|uniref:DUF3866 family protein n=1 Tax=Tissierella sp. TaxID=41274 RepID=UPI0028619C3A|nr:DUF3866 family protein [Tissierella sp.]MDR7856160.1 DUF3866 family protein [Tissierella sp.]